MQRQDEIHNVQASKIEHASAMRKKTVMTRARSLWTWRKKTTPRRRHERERHSCTSRLVPAPSAQGTPNGWTSDPGSVW
eukprot:scaffold22528_cov30-Tisochrysis_lutea.AAC.2